MYLHGVGAVTPVGLSAPSTFAAMRARSARFRETTYCDASLEPIVGATVDAIRSREMGLVRLLDLASPALEECLAAAGVSPSERLALVLGTQEASRAALPGYSPEGLLRGLLGQLGTTVRSAEFIAHGAASSLMGLERARALLTTQAVDCCVVGAVDSLVNLTTLRMLERVGRLKTPRNSDGLIPGEGAVFLAWRRERTPGLRLLGLGQAFESAHVGSDNPNMAVGLTSATRAALSNARMSVSRIDLKVTDVTGERYSFVENAAAAARTFTVPGPNCPHWHPASSVGVLGAATGACLVGWASAAGGRRYLPGTNVMCVASSDEGARTVAIAEYLQPNDPSPQVAKRPHE
jgi:3-oxoacyl-[acyl-carrier-protein] synthase-1